MTRVAPARHPPSPPNDRPLVFLIAVGVVLALGVGTQYVAWRAGDPRSFGAPLIVLHASTRRLLRILALTAANGALASLPFSRVRRAALPLLVLAVWLAAASAGPIYAPHRILVWYARYARHGAASTQDAAALGSVLRTAWALVGGVATTAALAALSVWRRPRQLPPSDSHGSAYWGAGESLHHASGLLLGRMEHERQLLRYRGEGHILTVAPTRSGKGVSCVIPNLLDHPGSVVVTDPKGENYAVTARWRQQTGQSVYAFDPFCLIAGDAGSTELLAGHAGVVASFNPLGLIDPTGPEALDEARLLADMLVLPEGRDGEQLFWNEEARGLLTGLILHVASSSSVDKRTLPHVRELLALGPEPFSLLLKEMLSSAAASGLVSRAAARILQKAEKERSGVISTAQSHTHFLDSPRMAQVLGKTTVDLSLLKRGTASLYLILPTDRLDTYARWLRLMIASSLLAVARTRGQPKERVLFLLDEFAHLGRMHPVQRDIGLAGGFGVTFWLVVQDLSQLKAAYGEAWATFLANVDVLQAFGANDWETSEYLSKMTGEATIVVESANESEGVSRGRTAQRQHGSALTTSEKGRRLLLPDEVRRLAREKELVFVKGSAPILAQRLDYLRDREFVGRADPNLLYARVAELAG